MKVDRISTLSHNLAILRGSDLVQHIGQNFGQHISQHNGYNLVRHIVKHLGQHLVKLLGQHLGHHLGQGLTYIQTDISKFESSLQQKRYV